MIRFVRLMVAILLAASAKPSSASAQVRPDSARKDTTRVAVPVLAPPDVDTTPKRITASDSAVFAREVARTDSVKRAIAGDTVKAPLARFERPETAELSTRLRFSREDILT